MDMSAKAADEPIGGDCGRFRRCYNWFAGWALVRFTLGTIQTSLNLSLLGFLALFLYGTFYYIDIPPTLLRQQLYFKKTQVIKQKQHVDEMVKLSANVLYVEVNLNPGTESSFLYPGLSYNIFIELNMPDSEVNHHAGTFSISSFYYDRAHSLLTSSSRLVTLKYQSWLIKTAEKLALIPFYMIGYYEENQRRKVEIFKAYNENALKPTSVIAFEIDNADIQIYDAFLVIHANLTGLKYYMYYYPITMAIIITSFIWCVLIIIYFSTWLTSGTKITNTKPRQSVLKLGNCPPTQLANRDQAFYDMAPNAVQTNICSTNHDNAKTTKDFNHKDSSSDLGVTSCDSNPSNSTRVVRQRK